MSEELNKDEIEQEFGKLGEGEGQETEELNQEEEQTPTALEQEAADMGWTDKETFVAAGGDPEKHVSPHEYVRYGKLQQTTKHQLDNQRKKHEGDIVALNSLHKQRQDREIADLRAQQSQYVHADDKAEFDAIQAKIETVEKQPGPQVDQRDPAILAWEADNPWVMDEASEKGQFAISAWKSYAAQNPGKTVQDALEHVDDRLKAVYPDDPPTNPRRNQPSANETGRTPPRRGKGRELSMTDLTHTERDEWNQFGKDMFKTEKAFLKAVADARKTA